MQSVKKHRRPKKIRVDASQFAAHYAQNVGSYDKAIINAENMEKVSRSSATRDGLSLSEVKESIRTANFWLNVVGMLKKQQLKMTGGTKARIM